MINNYWAGWIARSFLPLFAYTLLYYNLTGDPSRHFAVILGCLHAAFLFGSLRGRPAEFAWFFLSMGVVAGGLAFYFKWLMVVWLCMLVGIALGRSVGRHNRLQLQEIIFRLLLSLTFLYFLALPQALGNVAGLAEKDVLFAVHAIIVFWCLSFLVAMFSQSEDYVEVFTTFLTTLLCLVMALATGLTLFLLPLYGYFPVVLVVLCVGGAVATGVWLLWSPHFGAGLANIFFRHIMSLSVPLDDWLEQLAQLADESDNVQDFWENAMEKVIQNTAIEGIHWEDAGRDFMVGNEDQHIGKLSLANLNMTLYSKRRLLPTMSFNIWLLVRMAMEYRQAKKREADLAIEARMRSIHELGARTTHDLKNLLQAIILLCSQTAKGDKEVFAEKKREQLTVMASRLETTLAQLKGSSMETSASGLMPAKTWWENVKRRNEHSQVAFVTLPEAEGLDFELSAELFDRALENLLHNALRKQGSEGKLDITVEFGGSPSLTVRDNGQVIPEAMANRLFKAPLPSSEGMGIGLYQLSLSAQKHGYLIFVSTNSPGDVSITLERN